MTQSVYIGTKYENGPRSDNTNIVENSVLKRPYSSFPTASQSSSLTLMSPPSISFVKKSCLKAVDEDFMEIDCVYGTRCIQINRSSILGLKMSS